MSATPSNPNLRIPNGGAEQAAPSAEPVRPRTSYQAPGREPLQTLLAFSSLHEQIRRRQGRTSTGDKRNSLLPSEQFVPDEVLQLISERALAITGTDGIAIALAEGAEVRCRAAAGQMVPDVGVKLDPNSGFSGACIRTGLIVRCDDTAKDPRVDQEACRRIGVRSIVAVPLLTEQGVAGLIASFSKETHGISDGDIRSLSLLAELALAALHPENNRPASEISAQPVPEKIVPEIATGEAASVQKAAALPNLESLRTTLSPVTEGRTVVVPEPQTEPEQEEEEPQLFARIEEPHRSARLIAAILVLSVLAVVLAGLTLWWWRYARHSAGHAAQQMTPNPAPTESIPAAKPPADVTPEAPSEVPTKEITGIRHWSSTDSSTVAIDLQDQVQYEAHRLSNPDRIYFDLRDTTLASGVPASVDVEDSLLSRIRVAKASSDLTRVVLETKSSASFSVKLENNPYRLLIEIRNSAVKSTKPRAKVDLFAPLKSDKSQRAASDTPERGTWLAPADDPNYETASLQAPGHGLRIVLDAGHGGWDMGTVGRKGLMEKDLVLDIVARLGKLVTSRLGADVIYTRRDDSYVPLEKRTETANFAQADLFLSVHANYSDLPTARGVETYYTNTYSSAHSHTPDTGAPEALNVAWLNVDVHGKAQQSKGFADDVQQALFHALAIKNPALRNRGVKEASYVVLTGTTMPAILAEVSFVSSPEDEDKLENAAYRQEIAEGLYKGVAAYTESQRHVNVASAVTRAVGQ